MFTGKGVIMGFNRGTKADMGTVLYCFPEGPNDGGNWDTYEEALEAGIIKALKLI